MYSRQDVCVLLADTVLMLFTRYIDHQTLLCPLYRSSFGSVRWTPPPSRATISCHRSASRSTARCARYQLNVEPKRPPRQNLITLEKNAISFRPINITQLCKLSTILANIVNVKWAADYGENCDNKCSLLVSKVT